jgi:hypothetical protein
MVYEKDLDRDLVDVEIARYQDSEFVYQLWEKDGELEVDVVAETYLDGDKSEHIENTRIEGTMEEVDNAYEWAPVGVRSEEKDISIVSYSNELEPERNEPENLNQVAELERALESGFNDRSFSY